MNGTLVHKNLAAGRWFKLSLAQQLGNIGGEVSRALLAQNAANPVRFQNAVDRALELFDLTLSDNRWHGRLREVGRAREVFCDAISGGEEYGSSLSDLDRYFTSFALAARRNF